MVAMAYKQQLGVSILHLSTKHCNKLCFLSYFAGLAYLFALAFRGLNDGTYFSENALLPGLVQGDFYDSSSISTFASSVKKESAKSSTLPAEWISAEMRKIGLESFVHHYNLTYPLGIAEGEIIPGKNVYGILRALRTPSTESLVLSAPFRPPNNAIKPDNNYAIATLLAMAKFFRKHSHWAKDIIFLVTGHEDVGIAAWLEAYHSSPSPHIQSGELMGRGGSIQAAINLEMNSAKLTSIELKIEGINGQQPNLDLYNLAVRMCRKEAIIPTLKNQEDHYYPESRQGYLHSLKTMTRSMLAQSTGIHTGNHGLFQKYNIEALTMSSLDGAPKNARYGVLEMGRILEAIFRSLNNLLERFHQSFFFYVLPATERYISISFYMRPLALIVLPLILQGLSAWVAGGMMETLPQLKLDAASNSKTAKDETEGKTEEVAPTSLPPPPPPPAPPINSLHIFANIAYSYAVSFAVFFSYRFFVDMGRVFRIPSSTALVLGLTSIVVPILLFPLLVTKAVEVASNARAPVTSVACVVQGHSHEPSYPRALTTSTCHLHKFVALFLLALFLFSLALLNFSLALFIAIVVVPVALVAAGRQSSLARISSAALTLLVSPPMLVLYGIALNMLAYEGTINVIGILTNFKDGLFSSLVDYHLHGVHTVAIFTLGYFPIWMLLWTLVISVPRDLDINLDHQKTD